MNITNQIVVDIARNLGFDLIGFAKAEELKEEVVHLEEWLKKGYHAGMDYLQRNLEKRKNIKHVLEDAKSVISLGMNYFVEEDYSNKPFFGKISRYAWGKDYHLIIWEKLDKLVEELKQLDQNFNAKTYVDTGPVMDKSWAVKAGLGWLGKHTNVINKEFGSWIFLATVITNYEFSHSIQIADFCGTCRKCIDACPTEAIVADYVLDSNKCISYLTIENKGEISDEFAGMFNNWLFGCDICQEVCPWNIKFAQPTHEVSFFPKRGHKEILLEEVISIEEEEFDRKFFDSSVKRAKLKGLKRNAEFLKVSSQNLIEGKSDEKYSK
jgi:epoxyqueuosine reductase